MVVSTRPRTTSKNRTDTRKAVRLKCLVIPLHTEKIGIILTTTQRMHLQAFWFDVRGKGQTVGAKSITVEPNSILYFVASPYRALERPEYRYFYILQYCEDQKRFACSCSKGWDFHLTQASCEHIQLLSEWRQKTLAQASHN